MKSYNILIIVTIVLMTISILKKPKRMKLKISKKSGYISKINKISETILKRNKKIYEKKEDYAIKLMLINHKKKEINDTIILTYLTASTIAAIIICILVSQIMTMLIAVVIIGITLLYSFIYGGMMYVKIRINKIQKQFGQALEYFVDEYITSKNIKTAISKSYKKMPSEIGYAFEMLAREINIGYKESIMKFARNLSYIWGYNFAEILIMSYEGAGDISADLIFLQSLVSEEVASEEEIKTSMMGNRLVFIIINIATLIAMIVNIAVSDLAYQLYFYTPTGNKILAIWLISIIAGFTIMTISEKG